VAFEGDVETDIQACYCGQCQRWTGGGPLFAVRVRNLEITGETAIEAYHHSAHGERAFCRTCGSTLYWRMQGKPVAFVSPGLLDDQSGMTVTEEIFVDQRPDWFPAFVGAKQSTEAEMQAQLQAFLEKEAAT
jgi:hypothetical protein